MNILITKENLRELDPEILECAQMDLRISLEQDLPIRKQRELVIHAIIENFNLSWTHDKIDELTDYITGALDDLEGI